MNEEIKYRTTIAAIITLVGLGVFAILSEIMSAAPSEAGSYPLSPEYPVPKTAIQFQTNQIMTRLDALEIKLDEILLNQESK